MLSIAVHTAINALCELKAGSSARVAVAWAGFSLLDHSHQCLRPSLLAAMGAGGRTARKMGAEQLPAATARLQHAAACTAAPFHTAGLLRLLLWVVVTVQAAVHQAPRCANYSASKHATRAQTALSTGASTASAASAAASKCRPAAPALSRMDGVQIGSGAPSSVKPFFLKGVPGKNARR